MGNNLIKFVKRKRSNVSENPHSMTTAIFKLNGHCFDELFEYLSLKDLHSLGQTCKSMQRLTGEYFTRNYSAAKFNCLSDGIYMIDTDAGRKVSIDKCVPIPGFNQFITWIAIENNVVKCDYECRLYYPEHDYYRYLNGLIRWPRQQRLRRWYHKNFLKDHLHGYMSKFKYIELYSDEFKSVKKLTLTKLHLNKRLVGYILKILPNIEVLDLAYCTVTQDLHDILLKYCKNVRQIQLRNVTFELANQYKWLLQQYEKLEHLELDVDTRIRIDELPSFFNRNSNIRSFSCDLKTFMSNKDALLNAKVKLDTFELIDIGDVLHSNRHNGVLDLLYQLPTHGFCKRLHINAVFGYTEEKLPPMPILKQLTFGHCTEITGLEPLFTHLIEYGELREGFQCKWTPWNDIFETGKSKNEIFVEHLMNVERLYLYRATLDILLFIKKLRNLKKIKLIKFESVEILQLDMLNTEREKLAGAQKVTIYVPDAVFLATKWATKNGTTNFSLIEMKRTDSYEWIRFPLWTLYRELRLPPGIK